MQLHNLKKNTSNKSERRVGRGGKRGKTSGRGTKGQNARAGNKKRPEMRDIIKKIPKLRGRGKNSFKSIRLSDTAITTTALNKLFQNGDTVTPQILVEKGLLGKTGNTLPTAKIVLGGNIDKKLTLTGVKITAGAQKAIEAAGGKVN